MAKNVDYRLGLDLGTNSIGWAIYRIDEKEEPVELLDMGVRIFSDGRNPKTKEPLAVERRNAREIRRQIYRRKLRRKQVFRLLQEQGLFPKSKEECQKLKLLNPYELRIKALDSVLEPYELGRVLFNLSVRRGFKSNRKDGTKEEITETASTKKSKLSQTEMCQELDKTIRESGFRTIGEYLWNTREEHDGIRFVPNRMSFYPLRKMYEDEFNLIRQKQEVEFSHIEWDKIYTAIFYQRPLRPQERGRCQYMPKNERTYKAMPSSEKIRVLQEIRNINYQTADGKILPLSDDQEDKIIEILYSQATVKFDALKKKIGLSTDCTFNLESQVRSGLNGCSTAVKMRNEKNFGSLWDSFSLEEQDFIVEKLITADEDSEVFELLAKYNLSETQKTNIVNLVLVSGTTMLCKEVTEALVHKMENKDQRVNLSTAVKMLGFENKSQAIEILDVLPYYGKVLVGSTMGVKPEAPETNPEQKYGKISNPTVHVALNQTRTVVNAIIKEYGKPSQIVVELSRDLKASREAKAVMIKKQADNTKQNEIINKKITDAYKIVFPSRIDRQKFRLWEELSADCLSRKCLYCGKVISGSELFTKNIEIEHILPYGRTLLDSESNLTVSHAICNAFKAERSPFEAFGSSPKGYNWNEIMARVNSLKNPVKRGRFAEKAMDIFEKDSTFITRQLTDNAYLSKMALRYLHAVCDNVWSVNGGMTKLLRDKWEIDSILKRKIGEKEIAHFGLKDDQIGTYKKNRYDHRHHALDASVIALVDRGMVKQISTLNSRHLKNRIEVPQMPVLREELIEKVKSVVPSFKPDHGTQGKLSKETLLGKIKVEDSVSISEIKTEEDISKIKNERVRSEFLSELQKTEDMKKVQKNLKDVYPNVKIYKDVFVSRCSLTSLSEKNIEDIVDARIKQQLNDFISVNKPKKYEDIIQLFIEATGIKKVRCVNRVQTPIEIKGEVPRYLAPEDYFAAVIWQIPPKKEGGNQTYSAQYVRRDELDLDGVPKKFVKPHPAAKNIGTIFKGDYVEFSENGRLLLARIASYSATQNKLDIRPVCAVTDSNDWIISTNEQVLVPGWKQQTGQNFISVNVLFGIKKARFVTVSPIGRVFRK